MTRLLLIAIIALTSFGCDDEEENITINDVEANLSEAISTVAIVRWTTNIPTRGFVEFGQGEPLTLTTPGEDEASTEHEAILLGMTPDDEWSYQIVAEGNSGAVRSDVGSITTGSLPSNLPVLSVTGGGHDLYTIVPLLGATDAVVIINPEGRIVWYHFDERGLDLYRARLSVDGRSVIYNAGSVSGDPADDSQIVRVSLDGTDEESTNVPLLAHDFVEHEDGTIGAIVVEYRDHDGESLRGDSIVEISPDGQQRVVWSAWDCFDPSEIIGDDQEQGWTFSNALDFNEEEDTYELGMRNFSSIVKISRASRACELAFGGAANSFEFLDGASIFHHQHQFDWVGDRILVFDNDGAVGRVSRVVEYQLDLQALTAREIWQYQPEPTIFSFVLGDVTRLEGGDTLVNWSVAGQIERVTPEGEVSFRINSEMGFAFGFHTLASTLSGRLQ